MSGHMRIPDTHREVSRLTAGNARYSSGLTENIMPALENDGDDDVENNLAFP